MKIMLIIEIQEIQFLASKIPEFLNENFYARISRGSRGEYEFLTCQLTNL